MVANGLHVERVELRVVDFCDLRCVLALSWLSAKPKKLWATSMGYGRVTYEVADSSFRDPVFGSLGKIS